MFVCLRALCACVCLCVCVLRERLCVCVCVCVCLCFSGASCCVPVRVLARICVVWARFEKIKPGREKPFQHTSTFTWMISFSMICRYETVIEQLSTNFALPLRCKKQSDGTNTRVKITSALSCGGRAWKGL